MLGTAVAQQCVSPASSLTELARVLRFSGRSAGVQDSFPWQFFFLSNIVHEQIL